MFMPYFLNQTMSKACAYLFWNLRVFCSFVLFLFSTPILSSSHSIELVFGKICDSFMRSNTSDFLSQAMSKACASVFWNLRVLKCPLFCCVLLTLPSTSTFTKQPTIVLIPYIGIVILACHHEDTSL